MSWGAARVALDAKFITLSGINTALIHWPNRKFTEPTSGGYWKVDFLPAAVEPEFSGAAHEKGVYQVSRFVQPDSGIGAALADVDAVIALFSRVVLSGPPSIQCGVPVAAPPIQEPNWLHIPVSIPFQVL